MMRAMNRRGFSIFEYAFLIIVVLASLFIIRSYLLRALNGRYKSVGDTYSFGRQYDPKRTFACGYDDRINAWYDEDCFDNQRIACAPENDACEINIIAGVCSKNSSLCNNN